MSDTPGPDEIGNEAEFVDDALDDDEVSPEEQLLLDRKELNELGLTLDNPEGFADEKVPGSIGPVRKGEVMDLVLTAKDAVVKDASKDIGLAVTQALSHM